MRDLGTGFKWIIPVGVVAGLTCLAAALLQRDNLLLPSTVNAVTVNRSVAENQSSTSQSGETQVETIESGLGPRHQLTYEQWVAVLAREAAVMADRQPDNLTVLLGDSLSLWFPNNLLPTDYIWLNQGISGETSYGVLKRVKFLDQTRPKTIFLMIGINDLIRGVKEETVLANQREIVRHLKLAHPTARIVMQSILPHGGDRTVKQHAASFPAAGEQSQSFTWVVRLPYLTNDSIRGLNQRLAIVAQEEKVEFLDLHSLFVDSQGNLQEQLTTDGLHLSLAGYQVWRSQLVRFFNPS